MIGPKRLKQLARFLIGTGFLGILGHPKGEILRQLASFCPHALIAVIAVGRQSDRLNYDEIILSSSSQHEEQLSGKGQWMVEAERSVPLSKKSNKAEAKTD